MRIIRGVEKVFRNAEFLNTKWSPDTHRYSRLSRDAHGSTLEFARVPKRLEFVQTKDRFSGSSNIDLTDGGN